MTGRERRQSLIADLLGSRALHSQEQLRHVLAEHGVDVTQATLSRDLREMGVLKGPSGYRMPGAAAEASTGAGAVVGAAAGALRRYVRSVQAAASIVVLRTGPGQAALVAIEMDRHPVPDAVGTVAGDDTVFVATVSAERAAMLAQRLAQIAGVAGVGSGGSGADAGAAADSNGSAA